MPLLKSLPCPDPAHDGVRDTVFNITDAEYAHFRTGALIHEVFPNMPPADRERLITGYCDPCWQSLFGDDE